MSAVIGQVVHAIPALDSGRKKNVVSRILIKVEAEMWYSGLRGCTSYEIK